MDKVRLILIVVTIAINVLPIVGVLLMYQNNLLGLVLPPEINTVTEDVIALEEQLDELVGNVTFVGSQHNASSRTVTLTIEVTNPFGFDLVVNSMSAEVRCAEHSFLMGQATLSNPVNIGAGETGRIDVVGTWTEDAVNHFQAAHAGAQSIDIELTGLSINVNDINFQTDEVVKIPNFPIGVD